MCIKFTGFLVIVSFIFFDCLALAANHRKIAQHGVWTVAEVPKKAVYVLSSPERSEGKYSKRGRAYAMITFWQKGESTIHFEQGYTVKPDSNIRVSILDKNKKLIQKYKFIPHNEEIWAPANLDGKIISFMKNGYYMIVESSSSRGTKTKDTYNLSGVAKAVNEASRRQSKKTPVKKALAKKKRSVKKTTIRKIPAKKVVSAKKVLAKKAVSAKRQMPEKKTAAKKNPIKKSKKRPLVINKSALSG